MNERMQDRLFAACGIASAVLVHVGLFVGLASGQAFVNLGSSPTKVAHELAKPAGTGVWVGAYLGLLGFLAFLAFAVWATTKLGGGLLGATARAAATAYASVSIAALCVFDAIEFRAGHGMGTQLATALTNINEALYVGSWFLSACLPARRRSARVDVGAACARLGRDRDRPTLARRSGSASERPCREHRPPLVHLDRLGEHLPRPQRARTWRERRRRLTTAPAWLPCLLVSVPVVLVVDDDAPIRRMLERTLAAEGYEVAAAADGGAALAAVEELGARRCSCSTSSMPGLDGLAVCRRLRAKGLALPILLLTARDARRRPRGGARRRRRRLPGQAVRAGGAARARFARCLRRGREPEELLAFGDLVLDVAPRAARRGGRELTLSAREAALLELLLRNPRQVVSREQALERVWGGAAAASPNVVDRYVSYLRRKLGEPPLIETVRGVGFVLGR